MPRKADPDRIKAFEIYKKHQGKIELVEIAKKLSRPPGTIRGWKNKDKWEERLNGTLHKNAERSKPKERKVPRKSEKRILEELEAADLTEKQRLFCLYYIKNFNATMAAIKAGYSPDSAYQIGYENLRKPEIAKEIRRLKGAMQSELFIDAMDILERYIKIAFADITDYVKFGQRQQQAMGMFGPLFVGKGKDKKPLMETVNYIDLVDSDKIDGTIITEVSQSKDGIKIKLADKMKALDKLSEYFDLFPDNFKRRLEEEKLKIAQQKLELEKLKADTGEGNEGQDDGFMEALRGTVKEVWADES